MVSDVDEGIIDIQADSFAPGVEYDSNTIKTQYRPAKGNKWKQSSRTTNREFLQANDFTTTSRTRDDTIGSSTFIGNPNQTQTAGRRASRSKQSSAGKTKEADNSYA